ncbi:MAG: amidohydrolase family protein [Eubacteriales bacterium]|nr:amidohydrolase family protein [Eubacteriales bacterium]
MAKSFILKGDLVFNKVKDKLETIKDGFLVCKDGEVEGVYKSFDEIGDEFKQFELHDYSGHLIVPGLTDLHAHAPQYMFRGLWMDMELLDWLNTHTFPNEAKYADMDFAKKAYRIYTNDIKKGATTRLVAFGTIHTDATLMLMDLMEESGVVSCIGKVNMDRNSPDYLVETTEESMRETRRWLEEVCKKDYKNTMPILTPRFIPSCTDELMKDLGKLSKENNLPLQSHLSENLSEIEWVKELCPWSEGYGDAYDKMGCFGGEGRKTVMAHCVWSSEEESGLMKKNGVFVAHSPSSNSNLSSGIAPVRRYLNEGVNVGLATDVAGGSHGSIFRAVSDAIQVSKLYFRYIDESMKPLTLAEAFYLATKGGGAFFGKCGSFENGYEADILVLDEKSIPTPLDDLKLDERLERFVYLADERDIIHKYVRGNQLF